MIIQPSVLEKTIKSVRKENSTKRQIIGDSFSRSNCISHIARKTVNAIDNHSTHLRDDMAMLFLAPANRLNRLARIR